ncbi:flagellar hook protein FlgE [Pseudomonas sp. C27(2019)]|uniref:flagellar hook protein FlgE n=1 Tax=Pseudomonas sp. C27(2019) TaxID=2604941 RepID=UPI0012457FB1|nr:flagellar hook protein FlgE [Pseudomonas sp. C27(2019)]QEY59295.1 flagellar hook protein FlgE [Pseudomonas sp. C27(2019)]
MSFNIGLSGLRAATKDLNVTGNNIANAGTAGFKQSRAEFSDVYAASVLGTGKNQQGSGVLLSNVSQLFNQGNINYTQNALDLAINGNGFFQVSNNGAISYTRAGYFGTDNEGFIVDNFGYNLQGYPIDGNGALENGRITNLQIQTSSQEPKPTSKIEQSFNLNSTNSVPLNAPFDPADPQSYNSSTSTNIYDTQGNAHVLTQYFVKLAPDAAAVPPVLPNSWSMNTLIDGVHPTTSVPNDPLITTLRFSESGKLELPSNGEVSLNGWVPVALTGNPPVATPNGAVSNPTVTLDMRKATQFANAFAVNAVAQDGYTTGELAGIEIDDSGKIFARYTNGQSKVQGQVILADFANVQGLTPVGKTQWVQSLASGEPVRNPGGTGTLGAIQAGALEDSNVELSDQLVNLIVAQRNYQANAKTIETESAITQTIINLR